MIDIKKCLRKISEEDPDGFATAVSLAFCDQLADDFAQFTDGLEELNEKDKELLLEGLLEREYDKWCEDEEEEIKFFNKVCAIYNKLLELEKQNNATMAV